MESLDVAGRSFSTPEPRPPMGWSELGALVEAIGEPTVILDGQRCILALNASARALVPWGEGETWGLVLPGAGVRQVSELGGEAWAIDAEPLSDQLFRVRLRSAAGAEGFEVRGAHQDRLAALGALAAGLAHEVNNPAQTVTADLSELSELLSEARRYLGQHDAGGTQSCLRNAGALLEDCIDGLGRIAAIVRDLKSFSCIQPDRVDWVHPNEIVNQACAIANNQIRHRGQLIKDLKAFTPFPGDKNKLVQVVTNLLVNAAQALPEGSTDARVVVATRSEDDRVAISVSDSGQGIPDEALTRIFEPFFTTKAEGKGTGLGLAMSLDIARQHAGTLEVETRLGHGTRFELVLPFENGLEVRRKAASTLDRSLTQRGRVLVVDDEPGIRRSLGRLLGRCHDVVTCEDGQAALTILTKDRGFDAILCDLMMPEVDGPALYAQLKARAPGLLPRMVFMTGGAFTERAHRFIDREKPLLLDKPASADQLERALQAAFTQAPQGSDPHANDAGPPTRSFAAGLRSVDASG